MFRLSASRSTHSPKAPSAAKHQLRRVSPAGAVETKDGYSAHRAADVETLGSAPPRRSGSMLMTDTGPHPTSH